MSHVSDTSNSSAAEDEKLGNKMQKIDKLCRDIVIELKSPVPKSVGADSCLIEFHNCTPYWIKPFWIDFKGLPIEYPALQRGASIHIDTYVSQLWFFKALKTTSQNRSNNRQPIEIIAVPQEALDSLQMASKFGLAPKHDTQQQATRTVLPNRHLTLVCALCHDIFKRYDKTSNRVPCPHFTGETKLSVSELGRICKSDYDRTRIYSCTEDTHRREHSTDRRNIYLVESFQDLRERCFSALRSRIKLFDIVDLNLPTSLQRDYLKFYSSTRKVDP